MEQPIVNYPTSEARFGSVVSVAGRDFVVMPYESHVYIPKEIVDADSKHPERGMLNYHIERHVEQLLLDIMEYQRDALAATVVKAESKDERVVAYHVVMPVLMPVDTHDRWVVKSDADGLAYEERLRKAATDRKADMSTSHSYRMMEWNGDTSQPDTREHLEQERTELEQDLDHLRRLLGEEVLGSGTHRLASLLISRVEHRLREIEYLMIMED
jgi:hypothetical protein